MKKNELGEAKRIARWLASGCHWADGPGRDELACAAQAMLGDDTAMLAVYRYARTLNEDLGEYAEDCFSQSICTAALYAVRLNQPERADALRG